jgi:glycosyltransferase involved in cell wall biosynthesis
MKTVILIPAYNEELHIKDIIISCNILGYNNVIVIDDGSNDNTAPNARAAGAIVLSHVINRGPGAATQTGLEAAKFLGADIAVTLDADGQHHAKDIRNLIDAITVQKKDVAIGSRFLNNDNKIPLLRKIFNKTANLIIFFLTGIYLTDTQSGFKAFSKSALDKLYITSSGYEFSSEIIRQSKHHHLQITEIPISVNYTPYSLSKGQNLSTGLNTIYKMMVRLLIK